MSFQSMKKPAGTSTHLGYYVYNPFTREFCYVEGDCSLSAATSPSYAKIFSRHDLASAVCKRCGPDWQVYPINRGMRKLAQ